MLSGIIGTAGTAVNTAGSNLSIDSDASFAATSGTNIAIGTEAMGGGSLGDCDNNIAVGTTALTNLTTGDYNIAIGSSALEALTSNNANIGIGYKALTSIDSGEHYNVAIGHEAMKNVDDADADYNIAIGFQALEGGGDTKAHNIAIGVLALDSSASAVSNVIAIGSEVMRGDMTGGAANNTVGIGYLALRYLTTGANNTAIGYSAGTDASASVGLTTGSNNTALGYESLGGDGGANIIGSDNTVVGYQAGYKMHSNVNQNTLIGYQAGDSITVEDNNTIVGYSADAVAGSSNTVALGWFASASQSHETAIGNRGGLKFVSKLIYCDLGGTDTNDPAHATPICAIPQYGVVLKATAVIFDLNTGAANHSLKLVLSTSSSATDNSPLSVQEELIGAGAASSWSSDGHAGAAKNIDVSNVGTQYESYAAVPFDPTSSSKDTGLASINTTSADLYAYLVFANGSYSGQGGDADGNPTDVPAVLVTIEYAGIL